PEAERVHDAEDTAARGGEVDEAASVCEAHRERDLDERVEPALERELDLARVELARARDHRQVDAAVERLREIGGPALVAVRLRERARGLHAAADERVQPAAARPQRVRVPEPGHAVADDARVPAHAM